MRKYEELNHRYRKYLYRFELNESPDCPQCAATLENSEHVIFHCSRCANERGRLNDPLNLVIGLHNKISIRSKLTAIHEKMQKLDRAWKAWRARDFILLVKPRAPHEEILYGGLAGIWVEKWEGF